MTKVSAVVISCFLAFLANDRACCLQLLFGECPLYYEEPCQPDVVTFTLITKNKFYYLDPFKPHLPHGFNILTPLKIVIHGYGGLGVDSATSNVTQAYQDVGYNVILVDWGKLSTVPCYTTAYLNTWHVGQCIAIMAVSLIHFGISPAFVHLVGFSLGAHIAGFAGANVKNVIGLRFGRITGLDPALPLFATPNREWKLDLTDAKYVDIIHTSAGSFGKIEATGHADFYVNGGYLQPFCYKAPYPPLCSHIMAGLYFAETIRNGSFIGRQCESLANYAFGNCRNRKKAVMGEFIDYKTRGRFFVETDAKPPFGIKP